MCAYAHDMRGFGGWRRFWQAEKEAGTTDEGDKGAWFSDPSAAHGTNAVRSGVGKYISAAVLPVAAGDKLVAAPDGGGAAAAPAVKKRKAQTYGNFGSW